MDSNLQIPHKREGRGICKENFMTYKELIPKMDVFISLGKPTTSHRMHDKMRYVITMWVLYEYAT